ncbi:MFS transporter [Demequina aurantiaca]|uniref:MFS transporter n=1 Tax=Demequina aurantiaca TaxID=676200 RepID=UPI0007851A34|nr:MFS transporter [Demequina aurantiaca]
MLSTYSEILKIPGAKAFAFAGLLARLPISMFNISVILMVQIQYDSYEMAGRVAAIGVLVWALQTIPTARLTDRFGQAAVMWPLTILHVTGAILAIWTAMTQGPEWMLWIAVVLASLSGPLGSLTRARWSHILESDDDIHTAFALEGVLDEILFIGGPALATVLATAIYPPLGIVVSATAMVVGIAILLPQRSTQPPTRKETGGAGLGIRIPPAIIAVTLIALGIGTMFGSFDISTVAFSDEQGHKAWAGVLLGIVSAGSFVGGLFYGSRRWKTPLWKRTVIGALFLGLGFTAISLSPNLIVFAVIGFVAGATIAPSLTNADTVVQRVVKRDQITEGMAWVRIGMGAGVALGAWIAGVLIERAGAHAGLYTSAGAGLAAFGIAVLTIPMLRHGTERLDHDPQAQDAPSPNEVHELDEYVEQPPLGPKL